MFPHQHGHPTLSFRSHETPPRPRQGPWAEVSVPQVPLSFLASLCFTPTPPRESQFYVEVAREMAAWVSLAPRAAVGGGLPAMAQQLDPGRWWQSRLPPRVMPQQVARQQRQVNAPVDWACLCAKHPQNMGKQTETRRDTLVAIKQWLSNPAFSPRASPNILQSLKAAFLVSRETEVTPR